QSVFWIFSIHSYVFFFYWPVDCSIALFVCVLLFLCVCVYVFFPNLVANTFVYLCVYITRAVTVIIFFMLEIENLVSPLIPTKVAHTCKRPFSTTLDTILPKLLTLILTPYSNILTKLMVFQSIPAQYHKYCNTTKLIVHTRLPLTLS
ncbi:unnamed protein product, partial [Choristocarpus tenellus]